MRCGLCREGDICRVGKLLFASDRAETEYREGNDRMPCTNGGGEGVHTLTVVITVAIINDPDTSKRPGSTTTVLPRARRSKPHSRTPPRKKPIVNPKKVCERPASAIAVTEHCETEKARFRLTLWVRLEAHTAPQRLASRLYLTRIYHGRSHGREATTPTAASSRLTAFYLCIPPSLYISKEKE